MVSEEEPFVTQGSWLQVLITDTFAYQISDAFKDFPPVKEFTKPRTFRWQFYKLSITLVPDKM